MIDERTLRMAVLVMIAVRIGATASAGRGRASSSILASADDQVLSRMQEETS